MDILEIEKMIRDSISEEQDTTARYLERLNILKESNNGDKNISDLIKTFEDVANEEKVHIGEFEEMLKSFDIPDNKVKQGKDEVIKRNEESSRQTRLSKVLSRLPESK